MEETVAAEARKSKLGPHGQVKCLSCCKVFKSYSSLESHLKSKHESVNSEWRRLQEAKVEGEPKVEKRNKPQLVLGDLIKLGAGGRPDCMNVQKASTTAALSAYYGEKPSRTSEAPKVVAAGRAPPPNPSGAASKAFAWRIRKERLGPKKVKLTNLKRIILREREERKLRDGDLDSAPTLAADGDSVKPDEEERVNGGEGNLERSGGEVQETEVGSRGERCEADGSVGEVEGVHILSESLMGASLDSARCEVPLDSRVDSASLHLAGGSEGAAQVCQMDWQGQGAGVPEPGAVSAEVACESSHEGAEGDSGCVDDDAGNGGKRRRRRRRHRKLVEGGVEGGNKVSECGPGSSDERVEQTGELTYLSALRRSGSGVCEKSSLQGACSGTHSVANARRSSTAPGSFSACEAGGELEKSSERKGRGERRRGGPEGLAAKESVVVEMESSDMREGGAGGGGAAVQVCERGYQSSGGGEERGTEKDGCEVEEGGQVGAQTSGALLSLGTRQPPCPETLPPATYIGPNVHIRYCKQVISAELNSVTLQLLTDLSRFQERARNKDPIKAKQKQRLTVGMREVSRSIRTHRAKCIIVAPNIEEVATEGGLDDLLGNLLAQAEANQMPIIFALTRSRIAQALGHRKVKMSCVALCDYDGANALYKEMCTLAQKGREEWAALHSSKGIR